MTDKENEIGYVHRHPKQLDTLATKLDGVETLFELFLRSVDKYSHRPMVGARKKLSNGKFGGYSFISYREFNDKVKDFSSGLKQLNMKRNDKLGFYSINREEALVTEVSGWSQTLTTVFLYDTLGPDSLEYIINHAEVSVLIASVDKINKILSVANKCPTLKTIIALPDTNKQEFSNNTNVKIIDYNTVLDLGRKSPHQPDRPSPNDISTILYTSGTTGVPKGVVVQHRNMIAGVAGASIALPLVEDDVYFSYLPMAHVYEKLCQASGLYSGASLGFYQGDTTKLVEDVEELKPTVFAGVPRVYQRIYDRIMQQVSESPWHRRKLFEYAFSVKSEALKKREPTPYLDSLVFSKLKAKLGGRVRVLVSGSAPLGSTLHEFLEVCFCAPVIQGYGLSETMGAGTISDTSLWWNARGHVGYPSPCTEVRLESVGEMNYRVTDQPLSRGEICLRGDNIFTGYYKMPEQTKETFTSDGFFRTGDIGQWNPDGTLQIIDRKKNIFKLSQGEYVAAEKLEGVYIRSKYVAQIWIYGDSFRNWLVAIVVPDKEVVIPWAKKNLGLTDFSQICKHADLNKLILSDFVQYENEAKLQGFEKIKKIFLSPEEFTPDNELVTPTMKLKRPQLLSKFKSVIDDLYKEESDHSGKKIGSKL